MPISHPSPFSLLLRVDSAHFTPTRGRSMPTIQSATGPIDTNDLGFTLMHEHIRVGWGPMFQQYPELFDRKAELARAVDRLKQARAAGVNTVVDLTPIDLGRDVTL